MLLCLLITACSNSLDVENPSGNFTDDSFVELNFSAKSSSSSAQSSSSAVSSSSAKSSSSSAQSSSSIVGSSSAKSSSSSNLAIDDSEYPYAELPRIVIETENHQEILDRETEIPAKLQIWGESSPKSEIFDLTIRGRGNSSWTSMPKKSYKIEFLSKQALLGMPKDKDWALIANYADKSLMRNYLAYNLSAAIGAYYAPKCEYAELYLNKEYLGVYLVTETIKIGKNRVNIPKNDFSYIVEFDAKYRADEQVVFSKVINTENKGKAFRIHDPKSATQTSLDTIQNHIEKFEEFLKTIKKGEDNHVEEWLDIDESIRHYWVQEISRNPDAGFYTSVYFSWIKNDKIKLGPVWDFDLAFGNHYTADYNTHYYMVIKSCYWYKYLFQDQKHNELSKKIWTENQSLIFSLPDSIDALQKKLTKPALNNFKRWNMLNKTSAPLAPKSFNSYEEAVEDLKNWVIKRVDWLNSQI